MLRLRLLSAFARTAPIAAVEPYVREHILTTVSSRWIALKLLDYDKQLVDTMSSCLGYDFRGDRQLQECLERAWHGLRNRGLTVRSCGTSSYPALF